MTSATFNPDTKRLAVAVSACLMSTLSLSAAVVAVFLSAHSQPVNDAGSASLEQIPEFLTSAETADNHSLWTPFFRPGYGSGNQGALSDNYRLAGTYFEFGEINDKRRAIVDELSGGKQHIVSVGQALNDLLVLAIENDNILVRTPDGLEDRLWLSFRSSPGTESASEAQPAQLASTGQEADVFGGKQVGENRWVFERERLMSYYRDLMSEPERLVKLFDSLKPVYTPEGKIEGYQVEIFGEEQFFNSTGLKPGDVVRRVNSIQMSNRRRAEYLISEFVNDRINVVVMDIERDGQSSKFIYQIR